MLLSVAGLARLGLPSPTLFGALLGAMGYAVLLTGRRAPGLQRRHRPPGVGDGGVLPTLWLPTWAPVVGQAVIGVSIGTLVDPVTLRELSADGAAIVAVGAATLALSVGSGWVLARVGHLSRATGVFAMIAGGASGVTAIARELGADDRVVSVVQYLRILVILVGMPLVTALVFRPQSTGAVLDVAGEAAWPIALTYAVGCGGIGVLLGRWVHLPAGALLGPLAVTMLVGLTLTPRLDTSIGIPDRLMTIGYVLVGAQVGLRFTAASLRSIARLLPLSLALIVAVIAVSAGLGVLLARWTGQSALDGYLATTPGGLYAVLAIAVDSGADVTFVLAVQVIRLVIMLAAAPLLARLLRTGRDPRGS